MLQGGKCSGSHFFCSFGIIPVPCLLRELLTQAPAWLGPTRTRWSTLQSPPRAPGVVPEVGLVQPLAGAGVWGRLSHGAVGHDAVLSVGLYAALHGPEDSLEPAIQGEEVRLCEHRRELVFQQRLPHYVAESVVGLGQQLQVRECFPFYSGRTKSGDQVSKRKERNFSNLLPSPPTVVGADVWRAFAPSVFSGTS